MVAKFPLELSHHENLWSCHVIINRLLSDDCRHVLTA